MNDDESLTCEKCGDSFSDTINLLTISAVHCCAQCALENNNDDD